MCIYRRIQIHMYMHIRVSAALHGCIYVVQVYIATCVCVYRCCVYIYIYYVYVHVYVYV